MKFLLLLLRLFLLLLPLFSLFTPSSSLQCSTLNPKQIQLITFDLFAALMDLTNSMNHHIGTVIPELDTTAKQTAFVSSWIQDYANKQGSTFNAAIHKPQPFLYTVESCLVTLLAQKGWSAKYPKGSVQFNKIVAIWSELTPRPKTLEMLLKLQNSGYQLGILSNGDRTTLSNAVKIFLPKLVITHIFSSDYPVAAFKPHPNMYKQVIDAGWDISKVLHIAGSPLDARGARDYGMYAGLLHYPPASGNQPCYVLDDITKLPAKLGISGFIPLWQRIRNLYQYPFKHSISGPVPTKQP